MAEPADAEGCVLERWNKNVIISASYKTDIPTFYGEWFMNRLRAGYCRMVNPYNRRQITVPLVKPACEGFVFWTKNIGPFMKHLPEIRRRGYPFVVQHAVNGYPRSLEYAVVDAHRAIRNLKQIAQDYGPRVCVWRYDTIVFSSETPAEFHLRNFREIAAQLQGITDEVVISFMHLYRKTQRHMDWASKEFGFTWTDPTVESKRAVVAELTKIAWDYGIQLSVCSQRDLIVPGALDARCVDAERLSAVAGRQFKVSLKGNRKECGCFASIDIGEYDTCPHGCVYCYAVQERELAQKRYKEHDPQSEFLFQPLSVTSVQENTYGR